MPSPGRGTTFTDNNIAFSCFLRPLTILYFFSFQKVLSLFALDDKRKQKQSKYTSL